MEFDEFPRNWRMQRREMLAAGFTGWAAVIFSGFSGSVAFSAFEKAW